MIKKSRVLITRYSSYKKSFYYHPCDPYVYMSIRQSDDLVILALNK